MRERCEGLALHYNDERVAKDTSEACRAFRLMSTGRVHRKLLGDGREANHYLWCVGIDIHGSFGEMTGAEIALYATSPGTHKRKIQNPAND
jgi:hypothetical protein